MKKISFKISLYSALLLTSVWVNAREEFNKPHKNTKAAFKTEAGDCVTPSAQYDLDINNVRARLLTGGDAWWNLSEARYEVPKGDGTGAPLNAIFSGSIWITGFDAGGNLKCAAQRYRQGGDDYWPGPISGGVIDKATCNKYDRFFNVLGADIEAARTAFLQKGAGTTLADIPKGLLSWPGKGNPYLSTDPSLVGETFDIQDNLAPFKDVDGDGIYDPVKGDFPYIPCRKDATAEAYADQMVFWTINDVGNQHTESSGQAIGIQVNCLAYAFQTTNDINNMTFYKYEIINKSTNPLYKTYITQNVDPDLGCYSNDAIGCDTSRSLGIVYNRSNDAGCNGVAGYENELPLLGVDFFEGPLDDHGQQLGMSSFMYYTNGGTYDADPGSAAQYRNYQEGKWLTGVRVTVGGTGNGGTVPTNFVYPSNPNDALGWSECSANTAPGDRRFIQTSGPFTLTTGVSQFVTVGVVFVRPSGGVGLCPSFNTQIGPADDLAQALFNTCFKLVDGPRAPDLHIRETSNQLIINLVNPLGSNNYGESYDQVDGTVATAVNTVLGGHGDSTYTFEGYKVYQVANPRVSATELNDPAKALLVAQVDVKNGVSKIINFIKDASLGLYVPVLEVDGADGGITTSFKVTEDLFATGSAKQLVNHKTYYYTAVAYAYNNFIPYDQNNPQANTQLTPYLQGRLNFKIYSAIPHISDPRNNGTIINSQWGDGVEVKRIEGKGNGGNSLQLTPETILQIVNSGSYAFADTLTYVKANDPIGFKVTDPISLKEADFDLQFDEDTFYTIKAEILRGAGAHDTIIYRNIQSAWLDNLDTLTDKLDLPIGDKVNSVISSTFNDYRWKWMLNDLTNNVHIPSERYNDRPFEQQIGVISGGDRIDYGFSLKLGTPAPVDTIPANYPVAGLPLRYDYSPLPSSIEYENPVEPWLSFVKDQEGNTVANWIRSGTTDNDPASQSATSKAAAGVFDDNWYSTTSGQAQAYPHGPTWHDKNQVFENMANGTWAPYCLTANYSNKNATTPSPPFVYGPGFRWKNYQQTSTASIPPQNTLDRLASVDIVITPDVSKWSRAVVFETGEDEGINQGANIAPNGKNARKGQIRMHHSFDKDQGYYMDGSHGETPDTGRSWFPGYAINIETGERLNIAFGESSDQGDQNGRDMLWNPTKDVYSPLVLPGQIIERLPFFGGKHFIYVMDTKYDEGRAAQEILLSRYDTLTVNNVFNIPKAVQEVYRSLMWTSIPYLTDGYSFADDGHGNRIVPPAEVKIKLRVEKPYDRLATNATTGDPLPRYEFSTKGLGATEKNKEVAKSALDIIRVVPNPYLAYSEYETDQNTNTVKVTNLPNKCSVTIYSLDGTVIRKLTRAIDVDPSTNKKIEISDGNPISEVNLDNSMSWDLKNDKGIPIASGIYLFYVDAPGIGNRTLKWFGAVRPADTSNY